MATHSIVLAWRIPGTEGPGGLPSMGSHTVGHDWSDLAAAAASASKTAEWYGLQYCTAYLKVCKEDRSGLGRWLSGKDLPANTRDTGDGGWRRKVHPTSVSLTGKSHGQRSLESYSPWGHNSESDTTERLRTAHKKIDFMLCSYHNKIF